MLNTGANQAGRPSMGAWLTYGLGTENQNLPGFVVLCPDVPTTVGPPLWSNGFLPAINQGTYISNKRSSRRRRRPGGMPMPDALPEKDKDGKEKPQKVVDRKELRSQEDSQLRQQSEIFPNRNSAASSTCSTNWRKSARRHAGTDPQVEAVHPVDGDRLPDADRSSGSVRHPQGVASHARYVRSGRRGARRSDGRAARGKGRPHGPALLFEGRSMGRPRRYLRAQSQRQEFRPGVRRRDQGSEGARPVEGHAGGLRIRIRPHAGARSRRQWRTAPSAAAITIPSDSPCGWPAAR